MTEQQEKYLIDKGFEIMKPELKICSDNIIRDIPHYIEENKEKCASLSFNRKEGKFFIRVNKKWCYSAEDIKLVKDKLDELTEILEALQNLDENSAL
ncbi:hypothetical protein [Clostridium tagluense]|uniref:Uncharacterized protein n=1 Tax=Clostridium tagluense TaxID=360422 RepID=A0A401UT00_9CLOT|nr:hypothetical protein [Clostridium tagluense]GCD12636.1 hypothetical protein Ctaglu_42590 [Clostridium tagluense]